MIKSKKGISGVITAVIMIALVIAAVSVIWTVINNIVKDKLDEAGSCFDTFEKIKLNNKYTCYDSGKNETRISIGVEDIDLTGLLVSISDTKGNSKSFTLTNKTALNENYLKYYSGTYGEDVFIPPKKSGVAYLVNTGELGIEFPSLIQIAPIVNAKQCEVADTLQQIPNCANLAS